MQDYEITEDEFGEDYEADSFAFEMNDESDTEAWGESPGEEAGGVMSIANAVAAGIPSLQPGAAAHRKHSGRWMRRGNTVVLYGI